MTNRWGLRRHDLRVDTIRDFSGREVQLPSCAVAGALASQARSTPASQVRRDEVRVDQLVSALADIGSTPLLRGDGGLERRTPLNHCGLRGDESLRCGVEFRQKLAHLAALTNAIVVPLEPVADHARSDRWRPVSGGAQCALSRMVRPAQRTVRVLSVEPRVVRRPFRGQGDELRRDIRPQGHLDPALTGLVSQRARPAREGAASPRVDCTVCGFSLPGWPASTVSVDAAPKFPGSRFICACGVSARQQCPSVSANPGAPANGAVFIHTAQSIVKPSARSTESPRAENDGLALPWYSGRSNKAKEATR